MIIGLEVDEETALCVKEELLKRKQAILDSKEWIMEYVKEAAFPYLGLPIE